MAVRLDINANVTGQNQVNRLASSVRNLGTAAGRSRAAFAGLEAAAARGRASFNALATTLNVGVVAGLAAVGFGISRFVRDTFEAGNLIESLGIRFQLLFGSVEEGARAFDELNRFAARVPFSLEEIAGASGNLAVISEDAEQLGVNLQITGNVAAATGLSFRQTAEQIQRAFAGGIAAADVFRERGVRAMLGFEAGVTVSVQQTIDRFNEVFGPGGQFGRSTDLLAQTLQGQVSLVQDAYFQFRRVVSEQFFDSLTQQIIRLVGDFQTNAERLNAIATRVGNAIGSALRGIENGIRFLVENWRTLIDVVQAFIAFRVAGVIAGITAQVALLTIQLRGAAVSAGLLNVALRANPVGLIVTAIQAAVAAFVLFRREITTFIDQVLTRFNRELNAVSDGVIILVRQLNRLPGVNIELETSTERAVRAAQAQAEEYGRLRERANLLVQANDELVASNERAASLTQQRELNTANREAAVALADQELQISREALMTQLREVEALLERDAITNRLTDAQRETLQIRQRILSYEIETGNVVAETAESIRQRRLDTEAAADAQREAQRAAERAQRTEVQLLQAQLERGRLLNTISMHEEAILEAKIQILEFEERHGQALGITAERLIEIRENAEAYRMAVEQVDVDALLGDFDGVVFDNAANSARSLRDILMDVGITSDLIADTISDQWLRSWREGETILERIRNLGESLLNTIAETIVRNTINLGIERLFESLKQSQVDAQREVNALKLVELARTRAIAAASAVGGAVGGVIGSIGGFLGFQEGGVVPNVPGSTPGRDSVPALLTPGEVVIPTDQVGNLGGGEVNTYNTTINQNLQTTDLNNALVSAIRTNAEEVNSILEQERSDR